MEVTLRSLKFGQYQDGPPLPRGNYFSVEECEIMKVTFSIGPMLLKQLLPDPNV